MSVVVQQNGDELRMLAPEGYALQVARSIVDNSGRPSFNTVFDSKTLAPRMSVKLGDRYALNWSSQPAGPGMSITLSGMWTECAPGQSFSLANYGEFQPVNDNPFAKPNFLNVLNNASGQPAYTVIGTRTQGEQWMPIWVSPNPILAGARGEFQPSQEVQVWYQQGIQTATRISSQGSTKVTKNIPNGGTWYFRYIPAEGRWLDQSQPFKF